MHNVEHETEELAAVYEAHGMGTERAAAAAEEVMQQPEAALAVHAREELGIDPDSLPSAVWAAGLSLVCFLFGALLPVVPWFVDRRQPGSLGIAGDRRGDGRRRRRAGRPVRRTVDRSPASPARC